MKPYLSIQIMVNDFLIRDLGSSNGTFVNSDQIPSDKYHKLKPRDVIQIGSKEIKEHLISIIRKSNGFQPNHL